MDRETQERLSNLTNQAMGWAFALMSLTDVLIRTSVVSRRDLEDAIGVTFANIAVDRALGSFQFEGAGFDLPVIERYAKMLLHVHRQDTSA
jgi:uncharacterized protein YprB with RNaseH-like and TPR domain